MRGSFWDHIEELRLALIRSGWAILAATLLAFCFHKHLFHLLLAPLHLQELYLFTPLEGFLIAMKLSLWMGVILSSPFWLFFLLDFLLPALRPREKRLLIPFFALSFLFVGGGIFFGYQVTLPFVIHFFHTFNGGLGVNLWSLKETLDLLMSLLLAHGVIFELYVLLIFLIHFKLISYLTLLKARKGVIVAIFILAALLTPPDVLSQLLLALPMLFLFESVMLYASFRTKKAF